MGLADELGALGSEEIAKASVSIGVQTKGVKKGIDDVTHAIEHGASNWGAAFKLASVGLAGFATAFVGFAIEGVKKADELDAAVARIGAQTGLTAKQTGELRKGLLDLSTRIPQGLDEVAKSIEAIAKSGFNVADSLRIQEAAAKVATVTHTELGTVTNAVVTAMKGWGFAAKDVNKVTDTLITTVGRSRIDFDALSRIIATAAPIAKDAGISFTDLNAAIMAIGRSGLPARRAASGVITLIRALTSPAAQKQMEALGLHIDATTIKHDGLLKTLQKLEAVAGKHVSVIVRTKVAHGSLTKATEQLRLAEMKLQEARAKGRSGSALFAAETRVADARRRITALQTGGQIDYAKSLAATTKANKGAVSSMQTMVGGAAGLITANILLANGAKDYKEAQVALNQSLGKTNEEFNKVVEADLGLQLDLIKNKITTLAVGIGTDLLPYVAKFVHFIAEALPTALQGIGILWETYLKAPVTAMVTSFLGMADAVAKVLFGAGGTTSGKSPVLTFFETLAGILASVARDLGGVFDVVKNILSLPFMGEVATLLKMGAAVGLLVSGLPVIARALTGKLLGGLNFATGGIFKIGQGGGGAADQSSALSGLNSASTSLDKAAAAHTEAATKLGEAAAKQVESATESATKISEAAVKLGERSLFAAEGGAIIGAEAGLNVPEAIRNQTYIESTIAANEATIRAAGASESASKDSMAADDSSIKTDEVIDKTMTATTATMDGVAASTKVQMEAATAQKVAVDAQTTIAKEGEAARTAVAREGEAARTAAAREGAAGGVLGGLRGKAGGLLGSAGGLLGGLISKAIVPLLITQLATEILKAPIGDFIAGLPGFQRAGARIKEDFFGGLFDLFTKSMQGADAAVGYADETTIGSVKFNTVKLAKLGIDSATIANLQSDNPVKVAKATIDKLSGTLDTGLPKQVGESVLDWVTRITGTMTLPPDVKSKVDAILAESQRKVFSRAGTGVTVQGPLSQDQQNRLRDLITGAVKTDVSRLVGASREVLITALRDATAGTFAPAGLANLTTAQASTLSSFLIDDTENKYTALRDFLLETYLHGVTAIKPSKAKPGAPAARTSIDLTTLANEQTMVASTIADYLKTVSSAGQDAVKQFAARIGLISPAVKAVLVKKFGVDWAVTSEAAIAALPNNNPISKELARVLGNDWRKHLQGVGPFLLQSLGGGDYLSLKKDLAASIATVIGDLTPGDLKPHTSKPVTVNGITSVLETTATGPEAAATRKAIAKYLASTIGAAALAMTTSPDAVTAKQGADALSAALKKLIPDEGKRRNFIAMLTTVQTAGSAPYATLTNALNTLREGSPAIGSMLDGVANGIDSLSAALTRFAQAHPEWVAQVRAGLPKGKGPKRRYEGGGASGLIRTANTATTLTYGEAGSETAIVLRNAQTLNMQGLMASLAGGGTLPGGLSTAGAAAAHGASQTLYVDHLHVQNASDEQAILDMLDFMAPAGV